MRDKLCVLVMYEDDLDKLRAEGLLRVVRDRSGAQGRIINIDGHALINFASNDYLGLASDGRLVEAAIEALKSEGAGGGASRLLSGGTELHRRLEIETAALKSTDDSVLFGSGYMANVGAIPALARAGDAVLSDELNHASLIDGCRLSRAAKYIYRHADLGHLEGFLKVTAAKRKLVVTDSVFSMDGEIAPIPDLLSLCRRYGATLYIDDAHATGVLGEKGAGSLAHFGIAPACEIVQMGTYSKALGSYGAFVGADGVTCDWLRNKARTFIYSTAIPSHVAAASLRALRLLASGEAPVDKLRANHKLLMEALSGLGLDTGKSGTPIVPIMLASVEEALALSARLREAGFHAPAIRPPTVERPRIRITVTAAHEPADIEALASALRAQMA